MSKGAGSIGSRGSGWTRVTSMSQVRTVLTSGMRPESTARVRQEKRPAPIRIVVYQGEQPHLADGRHRVAVARERGDKSIDAVVEYRGRRGGVRRTERKRIKLS